MAGKSKLHEIERVIRSLGDDDGCGPVVVVLPSRHLSINEHLGMSLIAPTQRREMICETLKVNRMGLREAFLPMVLDSNLAVGGVQMGLCRVVLEMFLQDQAWFALVRMTHALRVKFPMNTFTPETCLFLAALYMAVEFQTNNPSALLDDIPEV